MISIEKTTVDWVVERFPNTPKIALNKTVEVWKIKDDGVPVIVVGIMRHNLIGYAEMWAILTEGLEYHWWSTLRQGRALVAAARERYAGLVARTKLGPDERFAKFFGFRETSRTDELVSFELP